MQEMNYISSRSNPQIQRYAKLTDKKYRESEKRFLIEGVKLFSEAVDCGVEIESVLFCEGKNNLASEQILQKMRGMAFYQETRYFLLSESAFSKITTEKSPEGVICVAKHLDNLKFYNKIERNKSLQYADEKIMLLCSIRDPGNIGTIARSAAAFGFDRLIVSADCADPYSARAMRASMGAFFKLKIDFITEYASVPETLRTLGRRVFCAELREGALSLDSVEVSQTDCFMIGNEGHGIPAELSAKCTGSVYIPIAPNSESLNAAIAASILAFVQK